MDRVHNGNARLTHTAAGGGASSLELAPPSSALGWSAGLVAAVTTQPSSEPERRGMLAAWPRPLRLNLS
jgi:hypothetical protein